MRSTFAVRETASLGIMGETSGAPLKPLRDDSVLRALSSMRGLRGAPEELFQRECGMWITIRKAVQQIKFYNAENKLKYLAEINSNTLLT